MKFTQKDSTRTEEIWRGETTFSAKSALRPRRKTTSSRDRDHPEYLVSTVGVASNHRELKAAEATLDRWSVRPLKVYIAIERYPINRLN